MLSLFRRLEEVAATPHAALRYTASRSSCDTSGQIKISNGHACVTTVSSWLTYNKQNNNGDDDNGKGKGKAKLHSRTGHEGPEK